MRLFRAAALFAAMTALAVNSQAGPDAPLGKFAFGISVNDGTNPSIPAWVPIGADCFYPGWCNLGGPEDTYGVYAHGWVTLPAPPVNWGNQWSVSANWTWIDGELSNPLVQVEFNRPWNAAGTYYWTMFLYGGYTNGIGQQVVGLPPSPGSFQQRFVFQVITAGTAPAWWKAGEGTQWLVW